MSPMSPRLLRPRASDGFDPRSISNLAAWYDAADANNVSTSGTNVAGLTDKSGNGRNAAQSSPSLQPTYSIAKHNGRNVVTNAAGKVLTLSVPLTSAATVFFVCSRGTISSTRALCGDASGAAPSIGVMIDAAADFSYYTPSGDTTTLVAASPAGSSLHLLEFSQTDSSTLRLFSHGALVRSKSPGLPFSPYSITLLGATFANGNQAMNGDIAELLVYQRDLPNAQRQQVEGYLAWKWGVQARLPYNHPYAASFQGFGSQTMPTDADALTYLAAVATADGNAPVEVGVANAVDAFIKGCKADGIWSAIKSSCILSGARTLSGALTPLVGTAPTNNGPFVSGDYNRKTGLVGNATSANPGTKYLDSNRTATDDDQNDNHMAVYVSTAGVGNSTFPRYIGNNIFHIGQWNDASQLYIRNNASTAHIRTPGNATGFIGTARPDSANFETRVAGSTTSPSSAVVSTGRGTGDYGVFGPATASESSGRIAFYSLGSRLDLSLLDARVSALYAAIGAAI